MDIGEWSGIQLWSRSECVQYYVVYAYFIFYWFSAEDWNLANPLKTCSLLVEQHGDKLHLIFRFLQNESDGTSWSIFAVSKIDLKREENGKRLSLEYFCENVVDSSRYFVVRIADERTGREARIGFGFRDRDEATDFREALQYYKKSILRDTEGESTLHSQYDGLADKLTLGEGEKIHINLGTKAKRTTGSDSTTPDKKKSGISPGGLLLKKPPPAPSLERNVSISFGDIDLNADANRKVGDESSTAALGEVSSEDGDATEEQQDEDDIWQDFEDASEQK